MAEEVKPVIPTEIPPVEPKAEASTAEPVKLPEPAATEPTTETTETPVTTEETPAETAAAPVEEKKEEKPVEPIYSGALGYKAPGLVNAFRFSKKYFWFGDEAVSTQSLSHYLRGEKPEVAHPTAAWSSQTGKGLLYFVKHADQKATPAGVLNLAEATDVTKDSTSAFHFKLHGHKHTFEAGSPAERNGWFVAVETAVADAKTAREGILNSEGYKEQLEKLGKPAALAAGGAAAAKESTPKKSTEVAKTEENAEVAAPARTGSSSSEGEKKKKSKSRSVSRGKRGSVFGTLLGKKEKPEEKKEEKVEDNKEEPAVAAPTAEAVEPSLAVPATTEEAKPIEEAKLAEPAPETTEAPVITEPAFEEKKTRPAKRGSIFGSFYEKLRSPTTEKKESDVGPAPPAKDTETPIEAPKIEEIPTVVPETTEAAEALKAEEPKPEETKETKPATTTPHKERSGFSFGKFLNKDKVKSPTTETAPKLEEPAKAEETPAPLDGPVETPKEEAKEETPATGVTSTASAAPAPKKRGSVFGNLTGSVKKEKDGEAEPKKENKLTGLFRNASKAGKSKKEKDAPNPPSKVDESAESTEAKTEEPVKETETVPKAEEPKPITEPNTIGDVVPDAVTVGQAPKSTPEVSATA